MNIGIDLRPLAMGPSGGISQLVKGVCEHMFALYPEHQFLVFCTAFNRSILECDAGNVSYFSLPVPNYFSDLDRIAAEQCVHVLFRTYPIEDTLKFPLSKQIFLIPDNQHEAFPEFFSPEVLRLRKKTFSTALGGAAALGTISEFARKTLLESPSTRCKDVFLMGPSLQVVHAIRDGIRELSDSERRLVPRCEYFLFPANIWKHKNHVRLLKAFRLLKERTGRDVSLVLTGHPDGWAELSEESRGLPVVHLGFVRPELLRVLLEHASALVFFSLHEGFGIPLLEAFDAGVPVICSNTTSLPEVGGDAVLTCDPTNIEAISALMERILVDGDLRESLVQRGKGRLSAYSWDKSAHNLMAACMRVAVAVEPQEEAPLDWRAPLPLVTIVTPSFNQGRFLKQTIESVLTQSYPNIQYLVIDGGSNDESVEILRSYGERFYWVSEPDRGQTHAINKGMVRANGEILAYLNSDDVLAPDAIERVVRFFKQYPTCDMVYGNADYIDENGQVTGRYKTADYSFNRLLEDCMVCQPATFWKRDMAEKIGPFDERLNYTMDYDYWLRIAKAGGDIRFLSEKLASSRLYLETKTLSARTHIYKEIFKICHEHAGQVSLNYYQGYWHHLVFEKHNIISLAFRAIPDLYLKLGVLHRQWDQNKRYSKARLASSLARRVMRRVSAVGRGIGGTLIASSAAGPFQQTNTSVDGLWSDNWLRPTLIVASKERASGHTLHIAGLAPVDMVMSIKAGADEIQKCELKAGQYHKVSFSADLIGNRRISIQFSAFVEDETKRQLAFLLQDTNMFSEADTW